MAPNGTPTVAQRLAALDALPDDAAREPAILRALEDESAAVRERAIRLAARYVEPGVLGAMVADGADVVNMSLSSKSDAMFAALHEVADDAFFAGSVLVCAANNTPGPTYPSQFASVVSVPVRTVSGPQAPTSATSNRPGSRR